MSDKQELVARTQGRTIRNVDELARIADMMARSGYFTDARDAAQAGVKILAGQGWGIQPFDAMTGIHIIEGKPSVGAGLMAAKVKGSGRYDYRVREMSEKACRIEFFEGSETIGVSAFTIEDAKAAGVAFKTSRGYPTSWAKFPRNMLFARAMSNGVKWYCPDVFNAPVYTAEELGAEVDGDGNILQATVVEHQPEPEPDTVDAEPAERGITAKQVQALAIAIGSADFGTDEDGKAQGRAFVAWLANRAGGLGSIKDLTASEANTVLDRLGTGENGSYRTDAGKLADALNAWHEHLDLQSNPIPDFEPNAKRKGMTEPIADDEKSDLEAEAVA